MGGPSLREYEAQTTDEGGDVVVPSDTEARTCYRETFGVAAVLRFPPRVTAPV